MRALIACLLAASTAATAEPKLSARLGAAFPPLAEGWGHAPIPDDGTLHVNGTWLSTYCKDAPPAGTIAQANTGWTGDALTLTVHAGLCEAAEIASDRGWSFNGGTTYPYGRPGTGYGYYEVEMRTASGSQDDARGVVNSFFVRGAPGATADLQNPEIDFEFLTNEPWAVAPSATGVVHLSVTGRSGDAISKPFPLPFNPSAGYHRYGFAWQPGIVDFFADGRKIAHYALSDATNPPNGMIIMANAWTGTRSWGGLPPHRDATAFYRRITYVPGAPGP